MTTSILITGANGFVGGALCGLLRERGIAHVPAVRRAASAGQIAVGDVNGGTDWRMALERCDNVVHLAARVHVMHDDSADPLAAYREVNVDGTVNLAEQAARAGVRRFVYVSSVKVNGESTTGAKSFTPFDAPAPIDPYGVSKREAEDALRALGRETSMETVIVRPPLVYGPGVKANFMKLLQWVDKGWPLPFGKVSNTRSLIAVDNLADFLMQCAYHPRARGQTFLVSDGHDVSLPGLIWMIARALGKPARLLPVPIWPMAAAASLLGRSSAADRLFGSLQVDISHAKITMDWRPAVPMQRAIERTVAAYRARGG